MNVFTSHSLPLEDGSNKPEMQHFLLTAELRYWKNILLGSLFKEVHGMKYNFSSKKYKNESSRTIYTVGKSKGFIKSQNILCSLKQ